MPLKEDNLIWVYINKRYWPGPESNGYLLEYIINDLRWILNFRGDAPLLIYRNNGDKHILQIDGDLFFPSDVDLADLDNEEEIYDGYLFPIEEALKMLNLLLYEDLELETDLEEDEIADYEPYFLYYEGDKENAFNKLLQKILKEKVIIKKDINSLK